MSEGIMKAAWIVELHKLADNAQVATKRQYKHFNDMYCQLEDDLTAEEHVKIRRWLEAVKPLMPVI